MGNENSKQTKTKYSKYIKRLKQLDYEFAHLQEGCQKDINEIAYLSLSEHKMRSLKTILHDILLKCGEERNHLETGFKLIDGAEKSLDDKKSMGEINAVKPIKSILSQGKKHICELKDLHEYVLNSFKKANIREKYMYEKIHANDEKEI